MAKASTYSLTLTSILLLKLPPAKASNSSGWQARQKTWVLRTTRYATCFVSTEDHQTWPAAVSWINGQCLLPSGVPLSFSLEKQGSHQTHWDLNPKLLWPLTFPALHEFFKTVTESSTNDLFIF